MANKNTNKSVVIKNNDVEIKKSSGFVDIAAKILSVVFAVALWFYVIDAQTTQYEKPFYGIEVTLEGFDSERGFDIISGRRSKIDLTLRGTKSLINSLTEQDIKASADLSGVTEPGEHRLDVSVSVPSGVTVVDKSVGYVEISVDRTIGKTVPVNLSMTYTLPDSYEFGEVSFSPQNIYISGPADLVEKVTQGRVLLDLGTVSGKVTSKCSVVLSDANDNPVDSPYIRSEASTVDVTVPVLKSQEKGVKLVVTQTQLEYNYKLSPESVVVRGDAHIIDNLDAVSTVPLEITKSGVSSLRLALPADVTAYDKHGNIIPEVTVAVTNVVDPTIVQQPSEEKTNE